MADYDIGSTGVGNLHHGFSKSEDLVSLPINNEAQLINGYRTLSWKKENSIAKSRRHDKKHIKSGKLITKFLSHIVTKNQMHEATNSKSCIKKYLKKQVFHHSHSRD